MTPAALAAGSSLFCFGNWRYVADCIDNNDMDGDIVEGAVATTLWDIYDSANDDGIPNKFNQLWTAMRDDKPMNITQIWTSWFNHGYGYLPEMNQMYWDHRIDKNTPPTCTINSPNGGGWYTGTIAISASCTDSDGTVSQATFDYDLGSGWNNIGSDYYSPWGYNWNTADITDSSVWVRVRGYDSMEWGQNDACVKISRVQIP